MLERPEGAQRVLLSSDLATVGIELNEVGSFCRPQVGRSCLEMPLHKFFPAHSKLVWQGGGGEMEGEVLGLPATPQHFSTAGGLGGEGGAFCRKRDKSTSNPHPLPPSKEDTDQSVIPGQSPRGESTPTWVGFVAAFRAGGSLCPSLQTPEVPLRGALGWQRRLVHSGITVATRRS